MFTIYGERAGIEVQLGKVSFEKKEEAIKTAKFYVGTRYDVLRVKQETVDPNVKAVVWEQRDAMSAPLRPAGAID